mmetsp:Transcript_8776/g.17525  ORF Transcript_8776/g.17525 Transcript_8776/m.17525 type:complete len:112 (+) Transcript_8776:2-337(+)
MTRPDLAFAFAELSKFVQAPGEVHLNVLMGWVDSDFAADTDTRRSVSGYLRNLLSDIGYAQTSPTPVFEDNAACILMSENPFEAFFCSIDAMEPSKERAEWRIFNAAVTGG